MNLKEIKELIEMIRGTEVSEIELEREGSRIRIRLGVSHTTPIVEKLSVTEVNAKNVGAQPSVSQAKGLVESAGPDMAPGEILITSPMVGTFYCSPTPGAPPFVEVGNTVDVGQTLCIIEAMKLMNEIEAEHAGRLVRILKEDKEPVEYGEAIFVLEPLS